MPIRSTRHAGRELALKMLFQIDIGRTPVDEVLAEFEPDDEIGETSADSTAFAHHLVRGTARHLRRIDRLLEHRADDWDYDRLAGVDRNILRLAVFEMIYDDATPEEIAINEAVELAKEYSTEESGRFVNGILGNLSRLRASGELAGDLTAIDADESKRDKGKIHLPESSEDAPSDVESLKPKRRTGLRMGPD